MCGILLYVGTEHKRAEFQNGLEALKHRGPDEVNLLNLELGINANIQVYLGHTRLSIVDDELSKQPMFKDKIHLIYNGEIKIIDLLLYKEELWNTPRNHIKIAFCKNLTIKIVK